MQLDTDKIAQQCLDAIADKIKNLKTLNIVVIGKSGVGKSTLINSLFRGNVAETGLGRPVTQEIRKIEKKDYPLAIYDTPGFELSQDQQKKVKDEVLKLIDQGLRSQDINQAIHCIWYCINVGANRTFDSSEVAWLREFTESTKSTKVPVIVVLTQGVPKSKALEMKGLVEQENLQISKVIPVLAQDMAFDEEYVARAYGLDQLVDVLSEVLPGDLQDTLQNLQKVSLEAKKKQAQAAVATAVAAAFGEGFVPLPFADAAMLIPTQVSMIAAITVIFGLDMNKSFLTAFVSSTIGAGGATVLGRAVVGNLFKLIPGVGTTVGGVISGTTAGLITTALGQAYILLMELIYKGELRKEDLYTKEGKTRMTNLFKEQLSFTKKLPR
ncbi:YcjF family protein [Streptococcus oriscaviae]|uniref:GTPase Era n=1 Tax=Streptococcus oriscaviae TaxID=2781599 RepID=A0ABX7YLN0_9STRE|nr:GTP-binding protein [Streptococcus oriscaviae]QUE54733.1 50S ribosome-binding GTPase [Streptococcus oriscaviae]